MPDKQAIARLALQGHDAAVVVYFTSTDALDIADTCIRAGCDPHKILNDVLEQGAEIMFSVRLWSVRDATR